MGAMNRPDYTDLHSAAANGDLASVRELLNRDGNPNQFDDGGCTPLHYAAQGEHHDVLRALLAAGANVNARDTDNIGNTAIAHVAGNCSLETARILIEAGADPTIRGWMQLNALDQSGERKRGDGPKVHALLTEAAKRLGANGQ